MEDLEITLKTVVRLYLYSEWEEDMFPFYVDELSVERAFEATLYYTAIYSKVYPDFIVEASLYGGTYGKPYFRYEQLGNSWLCAKDHPELQKVIDRLNEEYSNSKKTIHTVPEIKYTINLLKTEFGFIL